MSRRRAPRSVWAVLSEGTRAQRVGGAGIVANASPVRAAEIAISAAQGSVSGGTTGAKASKIEQFTLGTDGAQSLPLSFLPLLDSEGSVSLNGIDADKTTEWTVTSQSLNLLTPLGALSGDKVQIQYDYLLGLPLAVPPSLGAYPDAVVAAGPLVYYRMDGTGTTETDLSGHSRTGTLSGSYVRSRASVLLTDADTSTDFGASNQRVGGISTAGSVVTCPHDAGLDTGSCSVEFWTDKGTSAATACFVWDGRLRIVIQYNQIDVRFFTTSVTHNSVALLNGTWLLSTDYVNKRHIVITYDSVGQTISGYCNGLLVAQQTGVTQPLIASSSDLAFGWHDGADGLCDSDEFAFYGYALSSTQIAAHYAAA